MRYVSQNQTPDLQDLTPEHQASPWSPSFYTWKTWRGRHAHRFALRDLFFLRRSSWHTAPVTRRALPGRGCEGPRPTLRQRSGSARPARWVSPQTRGGSTARDPAAPSGVHVLSSERDSVPPSKKMPPAGTSPGDFPAVLPGSMYVLGNIFIIYSHSILGLCCIHYARIFISCAVLLCVSHALLFCLGLHRTGCPTQLICPVIALKILDLLQPRKILSSVREQHNQI